MANTQSGNSACQRAAADILHIKTLPDEEGANNRIVKMNRGTARFKVPQLGSDKLELKLRGALAFKSLLLPSRQSSPGVPAHIALPRHSCANPLTSWLAPASTFWILLPPYFPSNSFVTGSSSQSSLQWILIPRRIKLVCSTSIPQPLQQCPSSHSTTELSSHLKPAPSLLFEFSLTSTPLKYFLTFTRPFTDHPGLKWFFCLSALWQWLTLLTTY